MMIIRPITAEDYSSLRELAKITGQGFTSLQDDDKQVLKKLHSALKAFNPGTPPGDSFYLFVLEDMETNVVVGICGIEAAVGVNEPWYNYRVGTLVHSSRELNVHNEINTLTISNDHTRYSELCTLFLTPEARHSRNGAFLSKSRFMFMAEFPERFSDHVIAEMRGMTDSNNVSPFWEGLGRHFFSIEFAEADRLSSMDKVFIAELMPKNTIYTNLLPETAQQAIAQTHVETTPARKLLESEGMRYTGYIDIFDGGVTLEARTEDIRMVRESFKLEVKIEEKVSEGESYLVCNSSFEDFRCCMTSNIFFKNNIASIEPETASALNITEGDRIRIAPLSAGGVIRSL